MADLRPVLVSCHIAKTGGTSFRRMIESVHGDRLILITRTGGAQPIRRELYPLLRQIYWYARSFDSHQLRYVPPERFWPGARFSVILRDPIERFLSGYFFTRYHTGQAAGIPEETQREAWLEANFPPFDLLLEEGAEFQTKFIGCTAHLLQAATAATFADASRYLEKYDYVGFTECTSKLPVVIGVDFPELLNLSVPAENVTPKSGVGLWRNRVEPKLLAKIRAKHTFDFRLYEAAVKLNLQRGHPIP